MKHKHLLLFAVLSSLCLGLLFPNTPSFTSKTKDYAVSNSNSTARLTSWVLPRPADDTLWNNLVCKGGKLLEGMHGTARDAGQLFDPPSESFESPFKNFPDEIVNWGYQYHDIEAQNSEHAKLKEYWGIEDALKRLGVSEKTKGKGGNNEFVYYTHFDPDARDEQGPIPLDEQTYELERPDGGVEVLPYTGAYFLLCLNTQDGVIITMNRKTPYHATKDRGLAIPPEKMPALSRSSDIAWGMWKLVAAQNNHSLKKLQYFLALHVTNPTTLKIISRALKDGRDGRGEDVAKLEAFPGKRFWLAGNEGKALMGTPNGLGMAYFLMQHKMELGRMAIFAIDVFHCADEQKRACLLFHVSKVDDN